jgi:hypothetical protein
VPHPHFSHLPGEAVYTASPFFTGKAESNPPEETPKPGQAQDRRLEDGRDGPIGSNSPGSPSLRPGPCPRDSWGFRERPDRYKGDLREHLAKKFGMSGRNVNRLLRVLKAPMVVQKAVDEGKLALGAAEKVGGLPQKLKGEIARRVLAGEDAEAVVREIIPKKSAKHKGLDAAVDAFARSLRRGLEDLAGRADSVGSISLDQKTIFQKGSDLIGILLAAEAVDDSPEACATAIRSLFQSDEAGSGLRVRAGT